LKDLGWRKWKFGRFYGWLLYSRFLFLSNESTVYVM
jgi:hypothetical protein